MQTAPQMDARPVGIVAARTCLFAQQTNKIA